MGRRLRCINLSLLKEQFVKSRFNVYYFFAGSFVPAWLMSRQEVGAGAKLTYSMLAQQANSSGVTQLNFGMQAVALGEDEGQLAQHLMELEEVGLIHVSRGNVQTEDIRVFFPLHIWMGGLGQQPEVAASQAATPEAAAPARQPPKGGASAQASLLPLHPAGAAAAPGGREGRGRRRRRRQPPQPQSKHPFEVCLRYVTYQKEVLGHDNIWNVTGLARHIHLSGEQDEEIDAWLAEQSSDAA
jgi:hypothetical protein